MACYHRGGLPEPLVRAAPPDLTSLAPSLWTLQHGRPVTFLSSACGRWPGKKVAPGACSADDAAAKVWSPAPAPHYWSHHDLPCISVVAGMWSARGRGAALGRRCRRPAAAAAARVRVLGSCRFARAPAALWRCRSRARPRPLLGPGGRVILWPREAGRGAPARRRRWPEAADRAPPVLGRSTCC